ncbi:trypsin-like serine peptidase [Cochlodiniinecator piscidefendens]|uniref:trypsin-like serine peptidase n=1 Tax=Cochlodiniinecator piscidefendens TaxID=2715756 RepID=UPI001408A60B|nr:trypsin-like serine protease [Cochlodiniinecator piscidefendens]
MRVILFIIALCFGTNAVAQSQPSTVTQSDRWGAVGRLNIAGNSMCTGTLIATDIVLTAAHCMYNQRTGRRVDPTQIEFQAGLHNGRAIATRGILAAVIHPDYDHRTRGESQIGNDLAVLRLRSPIDHGTIEPFLTDTRPNAGDRLGVISYAQGRSESASIQQPCQILASRHDTLVMSCEVEFGASGAPVFLFSAGARPRLVSVISAKAEVNNRAVSIGTTLEGQLTQMLREAG